LGIKAKGGSVKTMGFVINLSAYFKIFLVFMLLYITLSAQAITPNENIKLQRGEIITNSLTPKLTGNLKGVEGKILIQAPPEKIWNILDNQENLPKFIPKFKKVTVLEKTDDYQKVEVDLKVCGLLPMFKYTMILDTSEKNRRVKFNRVDGCFKKLYGAYELEPSTKGTILTYRMFIDTGFYLPDFVCNNGLKNELPSVLSAIKNQAENS
jgi:carbon monoxide dehydrogenase subunit G